MTDTVRTQEELLALGTAGVPKSYKFQYIRDLIASIGAGVSDGGIGSGNDQRYAVVAAGNQTLVNTALLSPVTDMVVTVPANNTVYFEMFLWMQAAGADVEPYWGWEFAGGDLQVYWSIDPSPAQEHSSETATTIIISPTLTLVPTAFSVLVIRGWIQNFHATEEGTAQLTAAINTLDQFFILPASEVRFFITDVVPD